MTRWSGLGHWPSRQLSWSRCKSTVDFRSSPWGEPRARQPTGAPQARRGKRPPAWECPNHGGGRDKSHRKGLDGTVGWVRGGNLMENSVEGPAELHGFRGSPSVCLLVHTRKTVVHNDTWAMLALWDGPQG